MYWRVSASEMQSLKVSQCWSSKAGSAHGKQFAGIAVLYLSNPCLQEARGIEWTLIWIKNPLVFSNLKYLLISRYTVFTQAEGKRKYCTWGNALPHLFNDGLLHSIKLTAQFHNSFLTAPFFWCMLLHTESWAWPISTVHSATLDNVHYGKCNTGKYCTLLHVMHVPLIRLTSQCHAFI